MNSFIVVIISYLIGSLSGSLLVSKTIFKEDIRDYGSSNAGTTNIYRAYGIKYAILAFIVDFLKGILAPFISYHIDNVYGAYIASVMVVIGHIWPIYYGFKGGKGMATSVGVNIFHDIFIALIQGISFIVIVKAFKIVSIASLALNIISVIYVLIFHSYNTFLIYTIILNSIIVIFSHRSNIKRLINGQEKQTKRLKD